MMLDKNDKVFIEMNSSAKILCAIALYEVTGCLQCCKVRSLVPELVLRLGPKTYLTVEYFD